MACWYGGYVALLAVLTVWYLSGPTTDGPPQPCPSHDVWCGGSAGWLVKVIAVFFLILLALCLAASWVVLRLAATTWGWPGTVAGTAAAISGPVVVVAVGYALLHLG